MRTALDTRIARALSANDIRIMYPVFCSDEGLALEIPLPINLGIALGIPRLITETKIVEREINAEDNPITSGAATFDMINQKK